MSRWFRHYAGMMRDEKLVRAAVKSKQPVERVVWVWGAILESAAEINDGGRFELDIGEAAYFLRCDDADLGGILASLESLGRVADGLVVRWGDRQYSSDAAAERQRRYRERRRAGDDASKRNGDGDSDVTQPSRDGDVTAQETETELDSEDNTARPILDLGARDLFSELVEAFPANPTASESKARKAWDRLKPSERVEAVAAAERYARWFAQDCEARGRTIDAGLSFVPHLSTWLDSGQWREASKLPVKGEGSAVVVPMTRLDRERDRDLWLACEAIMGRPAPTSGMEWSFRTEVVEQARAGSVH